MHVKNLFCLHQILYHIEKTHMILDEIIANGEIVESNQQRILAPTRVIDEL